MFCLRVADNGVGLRGVSPEIRFGVAASLTRLLQAELSYCWSRGGGTTAEILFHAGDRGSREPVL
jgi:hypothetical protein